jgi:hypothetical protein
VKKIVEARVGGQVVAAVLIDLSRLFPWSKPATDADYVYEAFEDFWWRRIELPADVEMVVRDPRPGDPAE